MSRVSLRTRILLALLATSMLTLVAAALALLSPLQDRLQDQSRRSLRATALATRPGLESALRRDRGILGFETLDALQTLASRTGATVSLYDAVPEQRYPTLSGTDVPPPEVYRSLVTELTATGKADGGGTSFAVPLFPRGRRAPPWVLLLRGSDATVDDAVNEVRRALLAAGLVGLAVALLLGLALSTGLARRLGRLRRAAARLATEGTEAPAPADTGADEVGDLARALASMQQALRRQEEARRAFVATASHELRTPLTSLQGNLELLAEDLADDGADLADAREQLDGAQGQLRRLGNLAAELLDLSRLDAGVALRHEPVELGELCRAVAAEFELRARDRSLAVEVEPPPGPVWARADPGAVARAVRILLDNALRFSPAGETVRVAAAYQGDRATVEVRDRGPGVPEGERELIFDRFQRGSRTGGEGGFGLGLAIGRELARKLGGELAYVAPTDSADGGGAGVGAAAGGDAGTGAGARFVLTLPIELPRGGADDYEQEGQSPSTTSSAPSGA